LKHEGGSETKQGQRTCGERKPPAKQEGRARAQFQQNDQRKQNARHMVSGHMIQERLRAGDLRGACQPAADNRNDSDGHGRLLRPLSDQFDLRYQMISENQLKSVTQEKNPCRD